MDLLIGQLHCKVCVLLPEQGEPVPQGAGFVQVLFQTWDPVQLVVLPQLLQGPGIQSDQFPSVKV